MNKKNIKRILLTVLWGGGLTLPIHTLFIQQILHLMNLH